MRRDSICILIQDMFNDISTDVSVLKKEDGENAAEYFRIKTALRLAKTWKKYNGRTASVWDFECSLRNYLLVFGTEVKIPDYSLISPNPFGLELNRNDGTIYVKYDMSDFSALNNSFITSAFSGNESKRYGSKDVYIKTTNPFVKNLTGFSEFKSVEQQLAVMGALKAPKGYTVLISMLTGGGKSLVTQTIAYQRKDSLTVVVVPTISLMMDQCRNAKSIIHSDTNNEIFYYHSGCDKDKLLDAIKYRKARMLFISPETLFKNKEIRKALMSANDCGYLNDLVIDEAHIIIDWGSSFRVDFQCLDAFRNELLDRNPSLRTFLLSATYSTSTAKSLKQFYGREDKWLEIRLDTLRKEPRYNILKAESVYKKTEMFKELVCKLPRPMIVYVNTPDDAEYADKLVRDMGFKNTRVFTGKTKNRDREHIIDDWVNDSFDIIIATCAFGVGMDKKDVRTVLHLYIPSGPNQYYQECGRGGRDGLPCLSILLYTQADVDSAYALSQKVLTVEKLRGRWYSLIESDKAIRSAGRVLIDTSVKPKYNIDKDEENYFSSMASNADIAWNVYVILLLRRAGMIEIKDVEFIDDKYVFTVAIREMKLWSDTESSNEVFEKIRDEEHEAVSNDNKLMTYMLKNIGRECISEMFNTIYELTDEYCAGCNSHSTVNYNATLKLPIKKAIGLPETEISCEINKLIGSSPEMLILGYENRDRIISRLIGRGADVIVVPDGEEVQLCDDDETVSNTTVMIMDHSEYNKLMSSGNTYYISGTVVFLLGSSAKYARTALDTRRKILQKKIYIASEDIYIPERSKRLSEIINGACKADHIISKELNI